MTAKLLQSMIKRKEKKKKPHNQTHIIYKIRNQGSTAHCKFMEYIYIYIAHLNWIISCSI